MVPESPEADGAAISHEAREFWRTRWEGRTLMVVGMQDPVLGWPVMRELQGQIRQCPTPVQLEQAGHFVPEHGGDVALAALRHFAPDNRQQP